MLKSLIENKFWLLFGVSMITIRILISNQSSVIDSYYTHGFYQMIRPFFEWTFGLLPFPSFYLFLLFIGLGLVWKIRQWGRRKRKGLISWGYMFMSVMISLLSIIGLFLLVWGFNYAGTSVQKKMGFVKQEISIEVLKEELFNQTTLIIELRKHIKDSVFTNRVFQVDMINGIQKQVKETLHSNGLMASANPKLRFLYPKGSLLAISTAGFYWPFIGECHVDPGLHPLQIPHVVAHELAHAYGITDEGACNFIAWLACRESNDPYVRYAVHLSYWRQLNASFRRSDSDNHALFYETLDPVIKSDLMAIRRHIDQYPEYFTQLRNLFYSSYLKSQGVSKGLASYSEVVDLVMAWKRKS